jgi:hypothetical protein
MTDDTQIDDFILDEDGRRYLEELSQRLLALAAEFPDEVPTRRFGIGRCPTDNWRGRIYCQHTIVKLNRLAAVTGRLYVDPLQGSYSTSTTASAGTHSGGGAGDIKHAQWDQSTDLRVMDLARDEAFLIYWDRNPITGLWADHGHFIDPSCPNLSTQAAAQVIDFYNGRNGLANNGADFGSRKNVAKMWAMYQNRSKTTVASIEALFAPSPTPTPTPDPVKEWWQMAIPDIELSRIATAVRNIMIDHPRDKEADGKTPTQWPLFRVLWSNWYYTLENRDRLIALRADLDAVMAKLAVVPNPPPPPVEPVTTNPWAPLAGPAYGVDVSGHQSMTVCRGIAADRSKAFVIAKATEGKGFQSSLYDSQMDLFRTSEKMTGAYHFHWPSNPVEADFSNFVTKAGLRLGEVGVLDAENWDQAHTYADMKNVSWKDRLLWDLNWCDLYEEHYGVRPWIYLNWTWIKAFREAAGMTNADGSVKSTQTELWQRLTSNPLWGANPFRAPGTFETVTGGWNAGTICHQYGESPYDLDYLYGSAAHESWWKFGARKNVAA